MQRATEDEIHRLAAQLTSALTSLRQRAGATVERIGRQKMPTGRSGQYRQPLLELGQLEGSLDAQAREFQQILTKVARSLEGTVGVKNVPRSEVAMCCMGLEEWAAHGDLMPRRDVLARRIGMSIETIIDWENETVIPALADRLARALREPVMNEDRGYVWRGNEFTSYYDENGWLSIIDYSATAKATRDGIRIVTKTLVYLGDCVRNTVEVDGPIKRGRLIDVQFDGVQNWAIPIELPRELKKGESHPLGFRLRYNLTAPSKPLVFTSAEEQRVEEEVFRLQFHPSKIPASIWCFNNVKAGLFSTGPENGQPLEVDTSGYVEHALCEPVERGNISGISWRF
ncbi:helix-turn-helix domain-containing protein [Pseudofrankia saprophytica]|uniref:helix-turn-helix domain-containing protein n=1 Tax=Pseudofrankia saprophytica TaxID=298655 RepID=UPI000234C848|nr:helix-turn-helix transcriptional regulator [Pseudofrankia saprophytica]